MFDCRDLRVGHATSDVSQHFILSFLPVHIPLPIYYKAILFNSGFRDAPGLPGFSSFFSSFFSFLVAEENLRDMQHMFYPHDAS